MVQHRSTAFCDPETASPVDTNFGNTICSHCRPLQTPIYRHVDRFHCRVDGAMNICPDDVPALPCS